MAWLQGQRGVDAGLMAGRRSPLGHDTAQAFSPLFVVLTRRQGHSDNQITKTREPRVLAKIPWRREAIRLYCVICRGGMKGGEARTMGFNPNGVMDKAWKNTEVSMTIVDKTATIPIQDVSKREWAEEVECSLLDKGWW